MRLSSHAFNLRNSYKVTRILELMSTTNRHKILNDPVYGFVTLRHSRALELMDHPYVQRLRRISQLGLSHLVYPGAVHNRFHHAVGCLFLMQQAIDTLRYKGVEITKEEDEAVCFAILLHDIGHGPFSHALENSIVQDVHHEDISELIMSRLNKEFDGLLDLAIEIFQNKYKKKFLHQLVSSQLDMDRLDYLARDSFYSGVTEGKVGSERIIKKNILKETNKLDIKGLIILSPEGINGTISGSHKKIKLTITKIKNILSIDRFDIQNKFNSKILPYSKNKVKIKDEVVPINEKINFKNFFNKKYLSPKKWDEFISKKNIKLIDARKPFEYKIGTFKNALNPETKNFRDFKNYLSKFNKDESIGMFCTGGIRCEKASNYLNNKGFKNVYMLKGGILNYLNKTDPKKSKWNGECFVFDKRVTIKKNLEIGNYTVCGGCRMPLHKKLTKSKKYKVGLSCPNCFDKLTNDQIKRFTMRHNQMINSKK